MKIIDFPLNRVVYTTRSVVNKSEPVHYFSLDEDEDIQVFGKDSPNFENAMLISLEQILKIDDTISNILSIEPGQTYVRESVKDDWKLLER